MWSQYLNTADLETILKFEGATKGRKSVSLELHDADVKPTYSVQGITKTMKMGIVE
jgi:hypothetical protein